MSPTFIKEVRKLIRSKGHSECESLLIHSVYTGSCDEVIQGGTAKKLGGGLNTPFVRRRILAKDAGKSSGYRLYLWAFRTQDEIHLLFIHPKVGRRSATNITAEYQRELVKEFKKFRDNDQMVLTGLSDDGRKIVNRQNRDKYIF